MAVALGKAGVDRDPLLRVIADAETRHAGAQRAERADEQAWPAASTLPPLPSGKVVQPEVRCDFVDLRRTFVSLGRDELSGYVRLAADGVGAAAMLSHGGVVAAAYEEQGEVTLGTEAFARMRRAADGGEGFIDVVELADVVIGSTRQLFAGPSIYTGLRGKFLRGAEFLDYMSEQALSGGIQVRSGEKQGVVLLHDGVIGAYTGRSPRLADSLDEVMELFDDPACEVSVQGGPIGTTLPLMIL